MALWLDAKGDRGWAVGDNGVVLRYEYSQWKRDDAASGAGSASKLSARWLDPKGERGWAVGNDGVVLRCEYSRWKRDDAAFADSGGDKLNSLWLEPERRPRLGRQRRR